jgi:hypothetical protein
MDKKKKEMAIIALLVPLLAFVVYSNLISPAKKKKPRRPPKTVSQKAAPPPGKVPSSRGKKKEAALPSLDQAARGRQKEIARQPWGRDPFNPAPVSEEEVNRSSNWRAFQLSGIIPSPEGGVAILDGEVIEVGEDHRGYRLIKVEDSRITIEKDRKQFIIKMPEE